MITENDLQEQIEKYQGQIDISPKQCVELASMYALKRFIYPDDNYQPNIPKYSFATTSDQITYDSGSEFADVIQSMSVDDVLSVMDELMEATFVYNRPLYNATIRKLRGQG